LAHQDGMLLAPCSEIASFAANISNTWHVQHEPEDEVHLLMLLCH
jgi:hypothetical protein